MAFSLSPAARAFDQSAKSAADVKQFWAEDPASATQWLAEVARAAKNPPLALAELAKAAKLNAPIDQLQALAQTAFTADTSLFDSIGAAIATAKAQAAGSSGMGWSADTSSIDSPAATPAIDIPAPANFVGFLQKNEKGEVQFKTQTGVFDVNLSTTNWREEIETAFMRDAHGNPQLMTMKGFPSADGKTLYAQQFAPGSDPNFLAARVKIDGDKIFLQRISYGADQNDRVEVTHPEFVALLKGDAAQGLSNYEPAGLILPGEVKVDPVSGAKTYDRLPEGFFILGRTMQLNIGSDEKYDYHDLDTGYFQATGARSAKGLLVPEQSKPGGAKWDETDPYTHGSTSTTNGPRAFFYAKILPNEEKFPESVAFPRTVKRKLEITAVSDQGDNGIHASNAAPISQDFGVLGSTVPASAPEHTRQQGTLNPADD